MFVTSLSFCANHLPWSLLDVTAQSDKTFCRYDHVHLNSVSSPHVRVYRNESPSPLNVMSPVLLIWVRHVSSIYLCIPDRPHLFWVGSWRVSCHICNLQTVHMCVVEFGLFSLQVSVHSSHTWTLFHNFSVDVLLLSIYLRFGTLIKNVVPSVLLFKCFVSNIIALTLNHCHFQTPIIG